ncbi:MAG: box helicase [Cyanobacteria bacterium RYN_339]|nr:box helicase [Cyanobacteria bacterium RYN_339]
MHPPPAEGCVVLKGNFSLTGTFDQFPLLPSLKQGLANLGFTTPTPVQAAAIPLLLDRKDAIVLAKTGSGKTLAFGLPLLTLLKRGPRAQALVVVPTRELCQQVREAIAEVGGDALRVVPIYGGVGLGPQEAKLRAGVDVIVGTPGRLKDLHSRGTLDLTGVKILVLDEADEMLDKGFRRDIEFMLDRLPAREQTMIFSATMPTEIEAIARRHMKNPELVKLTTDNASPIEIAHQFVRCPADERLDVLVSLLKQLNPERALVFTRTKRETKILATRLRDRAGIDAGFLNGNMSQNARDKMMNGFRAGEFKYLVATDVAARGLDVEGLSHVIHFAVPAVVETYIHRSGRTGRAGNEGTTIILVTPDDSLEFKSIQKRIPIEELKLNWDRLPRPEGFDKAASRPRNQRSVDRSLEDGAPDNGPPRRGSAPRPRPAEAPARPARDQGFRNPEPRSQEARQPERPRRDEVRRDEPRREERPRQEARPAPSSWRTFRMALRDGHDHSPESFHRWLAQHTRVAKTQLREVRIQGNQATFEVEAPAVDRLLAKLKTASR